MNERFQFIGKRSCQFNYSIEGNLKHEINFGKAALKFDVRNFDKLIFLGPKNICKFLTSLASDQTDKIYYLI